MKSNHVFPLVDVDNNEDYISFIMTKFNTLKKDKNNSKIEHKN